MKKFKNLEKIKVFRKLKSKKSKKAMTMILDFNNRDLNKNFLLFNTGMQLICLIFYFNNF